NAERLLTYLALVGTRADYDIREVLMEAEAPLIEGARAAVEQSLVLEDGDGLAFRHALIREAILGDLMSRERRALHRSVGEAMERLHGADPEYAGAIPQPLGPPGLPGRALPSPRRAAGGAVRGGGVRVGAGGRGGGGRASVRGGGGGAARGRGAPTGLSLWRGRRGGAPPPPAPGRAAAGRVTRKSAPAHPLYF